MLQHSYQMLAQQMHVIFGKRLWYIMIEQFLMKYIWTVSGMVMVAVPLLLGNNRVGGTAEEAISERTKAFTTAKDLLVNGADAIERIMTSYKEVWLTLCLLVDLKYVNNMKPYGEANVY